ncbi:ABC transporter ATP-binding protein [Nocardia asteroides]|uniref:ABC transporter ATP-binding protein n=1 Tax=Nocardia asteroides TaxID=1824 RepID=UPI001E346EE4|nr:ABC transporter ATP-binding protein [Nocardia asteroides]UGT62790.1 ABC transporter ATP-binding protein/permease [Nocardia asteroides]
MTFGRGALLAGAEEPAGRDSRTLRTGLTMMLRGCRDRPLAAAIAVGCALINAVCMVLAAKAVGWATDHVVLPSFRDDHFPVGAALLAAGFVLGVSLLRIVTIIGRGVATGIVQFGGEAADRRAVVAQYLRLGVSWHRRRPSGQLVSGVVSDVETAWDPMQHFPFATGMAVMLLLVLADIALVDGWLALVAAVLIPLVFGANLLYQRVLAPRARDAQRHRAELSGLAHEAVAGRQVVRTLGITDREIARFAATADESRAANRRMGDAGAVFDPAIELMPPLAALVILAVGVARVQDGLLGVGALVEVVYLLITTAIPLNVIARFLGVLPLGVAGHTRVRRVLTATERPAAGQQRLPEQPGGVGLEVADAWFGYGERAAAVRELTLAVRPGAVVAVVGATGTGKSTLLGLLAHLLETDRGAVALGGVDTRLLAPEAVRRRTALVTQNAFLFADTVRANVTLGADGPVRHALEVAGAAGFVAALPDGADTELSDTAQLSGGQRQRIALARAVFRRPGLLLLDDATSALDPLVERAVIEALRAEYAGDERRTTVVLVGHRAATIALADTVVFLAGGRIVAQGTHAELLESEPGYRALLGAYDTAEVLG